LDSIPAVLPFLLSGDGIVLDSLVLDFNFTNDGDSLKQSLIIRNSSAEMQKAQIAVPVYCALRDFDKSATITLDSNSTDKTYRFAGTWPGRFPETSNYDEIIAASIKNELVELGAEDGYKLESFDDMAPLSGYSYDITCLETGFVTLTFEYDAKKTNLLIDPSDVDTNIFSRGQTYSRIAGTVEISIYMQKNETRTCRVLILGSDEISYELSHHPDSREPDAGSSMPGAIVDDNRIEGVTPSDFYNDFVHKYDYEYDSDYIPYRGELVSRYIDEELQTGKGYIDCQTLGYEPDHTGRVTAAIIGFDITPGESKQLVVNLSLEPGFVVSDDGKTVDKHCLIMTEPLDSFDSVGNIIITVSPPSRNDSVTVIPEAIKTAEKPPTFTISPGNRGNIVILCNTKHIEEFNPLFLCVFLCVFPYNLFIVLACIIVIYVIVKLKKRRVV